MNALAALECRDVWKTFGTDFRRARERLGADADNGAYRDLGVFVAVREITCSVGRGELFVVMGLSGSGKSTLVRCMSTLLEPSCGSVFLEGADLSSHTEKALTAIRRHKISMVFQSFALLPHQTVFQNIAFPLKVQGVDRASREKRAEELVSLVGLDGHEDHYPHELSGGQQQRVGIARSLATEPDIWFLDEPFSALDPLIRYEMQNEFLRIRSMLSKTIVFITHDFDEAIRLADRIAIMKEGRIVQLGTPEEVVANPADQYVESFTKRVAKEKVLSARSVMSPVDPSAQGPPVRASDKLAAIGRRVVGSVEPVPVADDSGTIIGSLTRESLAAAIFRDGR